MSSASSPLQWHRGDRRRELGAPPEAASTVMTPAERAGDFAQAMMDLGATICRPQGAGLRRLPAAAGLRRLRFRRTRAISQRQARRRFALSASAAAWWIERNGCVWLVRRPAKGHARRNGGFAGPGLDRQRPASGAVLGQVTHVFTHFRLELCRRCRLRTDRRRLVAAARASSTEAGLPTLYRHAADCGPCVEDARLPPEPFFSGPGIDRADVRFASTLRGLPSLPVRRRRASLSGATACPPSARTDASNGSRQHLARALPRLFRRTSRASPAPSNRMPMPARPSTRSGRSPTTKRRSFAARSASPGGTRAIASAPIAAPNPPIERGGWSRSLPELLGPAFPARRSGRDHACRA